VLLLCRWISPNLSLQTSSEFLFCPSRHVNLKCPAHQSAPDLDLVRCLQLVRRDHANPLQFLVGEVRFFLLPARSTWPNPDSFEIRLSSASGMPSIKEALARVTHFGT